MKKHIRKFYEDLYLGESAGAPRLGGKPLAVELGYPGDLIDLLPGGIWEDFFPCGDILPRIRPEGGDRVLNLGCGAGVDSILLRLSSRARFCVVNLDTALPVLLKARAAALRTFPEGAFEFTCADGDKLPFAPGSFSWIILNFFHINLR